MPSYKVKVNGGVKEVEASGDMPLLWVLRDVLGLMGTKFGCGQGQCGACTIHLDGTPARACITPLSALGDRSITTIEGVDRLEEGKRLQQAWIELDVPQCGYCQAGQIMTAAALLKSKSNPSDEEIDASMSGNLCRCATYLRIRKAIKQAASPNHGKGDQ